MMFSNCFLCKSFEIGARPAAIYSAALGLLMFSIGMKHLNQVNETPIYLYISEPNSLLEKEYLLQISWSYIIIAILFLAMSIFLLLGISVKKRIYVFLWIAVTGIGSCYLLGCLTYHGIIKSVLHRSETIVGIVLVIIEFYFLLIVCYLFQKKWVNPTLTNFQQTLTPQSPAIFNVPQPSSVNDTDLPPPYSAYSSYPLSQYYPDVLHAQPPPYPLESLTKIPSQSSITPVNII